MQLHWVALLILTLRVLLWRRLPPGQPRVAGAEGVSTGSVYVEGLTCFHRFYRSSRSLRSGSHTLDPPQTADIGLLPLPRGTLPDEPGDPMGKPGWRV